MELADILSEESVLVCTDVTSKRDVLQRLSDKVATLTGHPAAEIFESLNDRESLGSTGLGNGIAVPHGKFAALKGVMAVFMKLTHAGRFRFGRRPAGRYRDDAAGPAWAPAPTTSRRWPVWRGPADRFAGRGARGTATTRRRLYAILTAAAAAHARRPDSRPAVSASLVQRDDAVILARTSQSSTASSLSATSSGEPSAETTIWNSSSSAVSSSSSAPSSRQSCALDRRGHRPPHCRRAP